MGFKESFPYFQVNPLLIQKIFHIYSELFTSYSKVITFLRKRHKCLNCSHKDEVSDSLQQIQHQNGLLWHNANLGSE